MSAPFPDPDSGRETIDQLQRRIAELEQAQAGRNRSEEEALRLGGIVQFSEDAIIGATLAGIVEGWNEGALGIYGYSAEEMLGQSLTCLVPADRIDEHSALLLRVEAGEKVDHFETVRVRKDGSPVDVSLTIFPVRDRNGRIAGALHIARDATRPAELDSATAHLAAIVESSDDAIVSKDLNGIILTWNTGAERVYGYTAEEARWQPMTMLLPPDRPDEESEILQRLKRGDRVEHFETIRVRKDGKHIQVSLTISPIRDKHGNIRGASHVARDISDRKALETQLLQTQKLESLGVLAGGIAHDFNNLLTGILGNASLALDSASATNPNRRLLADIVRAAERASGLTRQLLAYAGRGRFITETVNLSELVDEISNLIRTSIPPNVQLRLDLPRDLPLVEGDAGQLQQVVMNLIINAAEAIGPAPGRVKVTTVGQEVDQDYLRSAWGSEEMIPGGYVFLEVHDTGCGMDEATKARIFDPFFTTKLAGRGLGLAAVMGIVRGHKGAMKVDSAPGRGTTFKVLFPSIASKAVRRSDAPAYEGLAGSETVLVVDDEEIVRETARNALQKYGYTVLLARNGQEAVDKFRLAADEIALVLLDLTMPVMGGEDAFQEMQAVRPLVKVLLSSGFNEVEAIRRFAGKGLAGFVQKPYVASQLVQRVRAALGAPDEKQWRVSGPAA